MLRFSILILSLGLTGCQHARSILQMDSNSSSPFLGLQLSVDASERQSKGQLAVPVSLRHTRESRIQPARSAENNQAFSMTGQSAPRNSGFVATSDSSPQTSTVKYSFPAIDLSSKSEQAAEIDDLVSRISK